LRHVLWSMCRIDQPFELICPIKNRPVTFPFSPETFDIPTTPGGTPRLLARSKSWGSHVSTSRPESLMSKTSHLTPFGRLYIGDCEELLSGPVGRKIEGRVNLILTSPPYPLNRKKRYGNLSGDSYKEWLVGLAPLFSKLLHPRGSIVMELGNAWVAGRPVQSLLHLESLIEFLKAPRAKLRLCQQFVCFNPSRLPSPAQWVTVKRIRVTDSFTHVWWMAKNDFPHANNRRVLRPYGHDMKQLLQRKSYNNGRRPSQHDISTTGFLRNNGGSIVPNVLELEPIDLDRDPRLPNAFSLANTGSNDFFNRACRKRRIKPHPARMPAGLASFFIEFLTRPGDLVLDPFAGSNTTGFVAELHGRKWISVEKTRSYLSQSRLRFKDPVLRGRRRKELSS
jgi:DNA modification methylase